MKLTIQLDGLPALQSGAFGHWRARRTHDKRWHTAVAYALLGKKPPEALERARVVCTRFSAARQAPDFENLAASFKPLIDGLVRGHILADDSPDVIGQPDYRWQRCGRGEGHITIEVTDELSAPQGRDCST